MSWLTDRFSFLLAVVLYGICVLHLVFLWRKGFRQHDRIVTGLLLAAFVFHTRALLLRGLSLHHCPVENPFEAIAFVSWTITLICLAAGLWPKLRFLGAFAAPALFGMGVLALMPALDIPFKNQQGLAASLRSFHATLSLLSYGAFGLSAVASFMFLAQEHDLKFRKIRAMSSMLPTMERLDKVMTRLMAFGFMLLTLGLSLTPFLYRARQMETRLADDPKVLWAIAVWLGYLVLLVWRFRYGFVGRRFARGSIGVFLFIMVTFWGINFFSPLHHF